MVSAASTSAAPGCCTSADLRGQEDIGVCAVVTPL